MKYEREKDVVNEHLEEATERAPTTVEVVKKIAEGSKAERISVTLARIVLECPMFLEANPCSIDVDLMLEADSDGTVYATLASSDAEHKRVLAIERMLDTLRGKLKEKFPEATVSLGKVRYADWKYVR